jgi:hypothetical protein
MKDIAYYTNYIKKDVYIEKMLGENTQILAMIIFCSEI